MLKFIFNYLLFIPQHNFYNSAFRFQFEQNFFDVYYSINVQGLKAFSTLDTVIVQQLINQIWVADGKNWSKRIWGNTELLAKTLKC